MQNDRHDPSTHPAKLTDAAYQRLDAVMLWYLRKQYRYVQVIEREQVERD